MYWSIEKFIGTRYLFVGRAASTTRLISLIAILAIALGVSVLLTISSIMNGFEEELRSRILALSSHVQVDVSSLTPDQIGVQRLNIENLSFVESVAPYIEEDLILQSGNAVQLVRARGVDTMMEMRVTDLQEHLVSVRPLTDRSYGIYLGRETAGKLGVGLGGVITAVIPKPLVTPVGLMPRIKKLEVIGIFEFGYPEHDSGVALISLKDAQRLVWIISMKKAIRV